jgi:hypothetical protein
MSAEALGFTPTAFSLQAALSRSRGRLCPDAGLGFFGRFADETDEALDGIPPVLLLGAVPPSVDDEYAGFCQSLAGEADQAFSNVFREVGRAVNIETELNGGGHFIDILTPGSGGTDEVQRDFCIVDGYIGGDLYRRKVFPLFSLS